MKLLILILGVVLLSAAFDLEREEMRIKEKVLIQDSADEE